MGSESEPDAESDGGQTADEGATDKFEKSEPEPAVESESEGDSALGSKAELDPGSDETNENDDTDEGNEIIKRNDDDEAEEATESNVEVDGTENAADTEQAMETVGDPAFEFEATTAESIYVQTATFDWLDDTKLEVESLLRREHDMCDPTGREFHDTFVRVATEYLEKIVDVVLECRNG